MANLYSKKIPFWDPLLRVIRKAESKSAGEYDAVVSYRKPFPGLSKKIIIDAVKIAPKTYIGAYQFNKNNLLTWSKSTGLSPDKDIFNSLNQDSIAIYLIESIRNGQNWINNSMSTEQLMINLSKEWAGLPVPKNMNGFSRPVRKGESFYADVSTNKATVSVNEVLNAIKLIDPSKKYDIDSEPEILPSPFIPSPIQPVIINENEYLQFIQD